MKLIHSGDQKSKELEFNTLEEAVNYIAHEEDVDPSITLKEEIRHALEDDGEYWSYLQDVYKLARQ
jgi:hypothetical protein